MRKRGWRFNYSGRREKKIGGKKKKEKGRIHLSQLLSEQRWTSFFVDERKRGERSSFRDSPRDRVVKSLKNGRGTCRRDESGTRPGTTRRGALVARRKGAEARGPGRLIIGLTLNFCNKCRHPASREGNGPPQHRKQRKQLVGSRKKKKRGDKRGDSRPRPS